MDYKDWIDLATKLWAILVFGIGLYQYWIAQKWKKTEFVAQQMKDFDSAPYTSVAFRLIDWEDWVVQVPGEKAKLTVTDEFLCKALRQEDDGEFDDDEAYVRECFDAFWGGIDRFASFVDYGLLTREDLVPYLEYWVRIILGLKEHRTAKVRRAISNHAEHRGFYRAIKLVSELGRDISKRAGTPLITEATQAKLGDTARTRA